MRCPAQIRPFPVGNTTTIQCDQEAGHKRRHYGALRDYAYPGSSTTIHWEELDRRNFTGEWIECPSKNCILPAGHPRDHAS